MKKNRIWIFGGTSSGKTTLAKRISSSLKLPYYSTDFMKYSKNFGKKFSEKTKTRKIKELSKKKKWVCEGTNFGEWVWLHLEKQIM